MKQNQQPQPTNYNEALEILGKYKAKKIANNTYLEQSSTGFSIAIRLHATDIVTFFEDGTTELNSGGYQTVTTIDRINRYLPLGSKVTNHNNCPWFYGPNSEDELDNVVKFYDGLTIDSVTGKLMIAFNLTENDKRQ